MRNENHFLIIGLIANLLDKITTFAALNTAGLHESNPFLNFLINNFGLIPALIAALLLGSIAVFVLANFLRLSQSRFKTFVWIIPLIYIVVVSSNIYLIDHVTIGAFS